MSDDEIHAEGSDWRPGVPPPPPPPGRPATAGPPGTEHPSPDDADPGGLPPRGGRGWALYALLALALVAVAGALWFTNRSSEPADPAPGAAPEEVACGAAAPPPARPQRYVAPPPKVLQKKVDYTAIVRTSCGAFEMDLLEDKAKDAVNNFVYLVQDDFYNGLTWHGVTEDLIETGDPNGRTGDPPDGPGYSIPADAPRNPDAYVFGKVAFAPQSEDQASGSRFFIIVHDAQGALAGDPEPLPGDEEHTVFARVPKEFFEVLIDMAGAEGALYIESIEIGIAS